MRRSMLAVVGALLLAATAEAQITVPIHNHIATVGPLSGATDLRPAGARSLLGAVNDSAGVVYCTVDDTTATANTGIRLDAAGGSFLFDAKVPRGALRCYSAAGGSRLLIMEGR